MMDKIMEVLRKKHGKDLTFNDGESYYVFFKDGLYSIYLDEDEMTLKVDVAFQTEGKVFVYASEERIEDLLI